MGYRPTSQAEQLYLLRVTTDHNGQRVQVVNHHSGERKRFATLSDAFDYIAQVSAETPPTLSSDTAASILAHGLTKTKQQPMPKQKGRKNHP